MEGRCGLPASGFPHTHGNAGSSKNRARMDFGASCGESLKLKSHQDLVDLFPGSTITNPFISCNLNLLNHRTQRFQRMINTFSNTNYFLFVLLFLSLPLCPHVSIHSLLRARNVNVSNTHWNIYIIKIHIKLKCLQTLFMQMWARRTLSPIWDADAHLAVSKVSTSSSTSDGDYCDYSLSQTASMVTDGN